MTAIKMASLTGKLQRPTPQSLPKLVIPESNRVLPEEITPSRAEQFLAYCSRFQQALAYRNMIKVGSGSTAPVQIQISLSGIAYDASASTAASGTTASFVSAREIPYSPGTEDIPTLDFDRRDWRALRRKTEELEHVKAQHGHWIALLKEDHRNPGTIKQCKYWRKVREALGAEVQLIPERLRIRREFREEFNWRFPQ